MVTGARISKKDAAIVELSAETVDTSGHISSDTQSAPLEATCMRRSICHRSSGATSEFSRRQAGKLDRFETEITVQHHCCGQKFQRCSPLPLTVRTRGGVRINTARCAHLGVCALISLVGPIDEEAPESDGPSKAEDRLHSLTDHDCIFEDFGRSSGVVR